LLRRLRALGVEARTFGPSEALAIAQLAIGVSEAGALRLAIAGAEPNTLTLGPIDTAEHTDLQLP